ncbi:glycoside hydrolase family 78 protein [Microbacterium awajiense]|uniref:alpha-L-rhamnosidase n=2 Tax=Microbacterium awajiense TaxID=415214 RepID=A0ABP7AUB5_9MICO
MADVESETSTMTPRTTPPTITRLRAEQVLPGEVLGEPRPRLSWMLDGGDPHFRQDRFEVELTARSGVELYRGHGSENVLVAWPFRPLSSRESARVRVRCGSSDGEWTPWSPSCVIEAGLLDPADWSAQFVSPRTLAGMEDGAPHVFTEFEVAQAPVAATLYMSAHGIYEPWLNGVRVGQDVFAPGWTTYQKRVRYQAYDVTGVVAAGRNTLGALLGNGWYRGQLVWKGNRRSYGKRLALLAQLELRFADGTTRTISSDGSWRASATGILFDDFYDGQTQDLRISLQPDPANAEGVDVIKADLSRLVARRGPAVRPTERIPARSLKRSPSGRLLVDFGQNVAGWVELTVAGLTEGAEVVVRHAEVLEGGELARRPLRSAQATCTYILAGEHAQTLRPTFTYSGFRYIDILGLDEAQLVEVSAVVLGTDLERTGWLTTSDADLNRLHDNAVWSARGNFLDVPTDCPQRDERLGWTGDIQLFSPTANFLFDTSGFLAGWLEDLAAEQLPDGSVPFIIPDVLREGTAAAAGWGDAAVVVPSELHRAFADEGVLARQYSSMRAWVDKVTSLADEDHVWDARDQFGDWLDPTAPPDAPMKAQADQAVVATACYARSARLLAQAAHTLGEVRDARRYSALADDIARGFQARFVTADGRVLSDCQTVYALALCGDLISDEAVRAAAGDRLAELVVEADYTVATGLQGTAVILDALVMAGRVDVAYRMLRETQMPSWLYAVGMGATTIWERWDSMLPDGSVNPGEMTSFNHYANGAVVDWMHRRIGGIAPTSPGYRTFEVRPLVTRDLDFARARHRCPHGDIAVEWSREGQVVDLSVRVPHGTSATVWVPGSREPVRAETGTHRWRGVLHPAGAAPTV